MGTDPQVCAEVPPGVPARGVPEGAAPLPSWDLVPDGRKGARQDGPAWGPGCKRWSRGPQPAVLMDLKYDLREPFRSPPLSGDAVWGVYLG